MTPHQSLPTWKTIIPLGISQTFYYSALYYLFPAMMPSVLESRGWANVDYTFGITLIMLFSGLMAPLMGTFVDRKKGLYLIGLAGILGGTALFLIPFFPSLWLFYACTIVVGVALAMGTYEVCFSHLTRVYGEKATKSITMITIMAGFASTITFPAARAIIVHLGWEWGFILFGSVIAVTGVFLLIFARQTKQTVLSYSMEEEQKKSDPAIPFPIVLPLVLLVLSKALVMFTTKSVHTQVLPLFQSMDFSSEQATWLASSFGPMQVLGRVLLLFAARKKVISPFLAKLIIHGILIGAAVLLTLSNWFNPLVLFFILFHGAGVGTFSILSPQVNAKVFGQGKVGKMGGLLAFFSQVTTSMAPVFTSFIVMSFGVQQIPIFLILTTSLAFLSFLGVKRIKDWEEKKLLQVADKREPFLELS